jgi:hypothetical protein
MTSKEAIPVFNATTTAENPAPSVGSSVSTTKILAIGHWTAKAMPIARASMLPLEMRATARLYLAGKID